MASSYNATSGRYDPSKIQPKFRDCAFASDKNANNFAQWTKLISGIIRNITGGAPLEAFLDQFLNRKVSQATRPSFLNDPRLASSVRGLHSPAASSRTTSTATRLPLPRDSPSAPSWVQTYDTYADLPEDSQALDLLLFQSLYTIVTGPYLSIIADLQGDDARYTYVIIAMWQHNAMGASSRRLNALNDMMDLQYVGDAGKWKLELMAKAREVYASDLTIEHFIMHCAFKSFEGKNTQVQAMMAEDINANDGSDAFALEKLATKYSQFVATLTSAKVTQIHAATKDDRHKRSLIDCSIFSRHQLINSVNAMHDVVAKWV